MVLCTQTTKCCSFNHSATSASGLAVIKTPTFFPNKAREWQKGMPGNSLKDPYFWPVDVYAVKIPIPAAGNPIKGDPLQGNYRVTCPAFVGEKWSHGFRLVGALLVRGGGTVHLSSQKR